MEKDAQEKVEELTRALAESTGVSPEDVGKVLHRLGVESAVSNRLEQISIQNARLAIGQVPV